MDAINGDTWDGSGTPVPGQSPGVYMVGTNRFEKLFFDVFLEEFLCEFVDYAVTTGCEIPRATSSYKVVTDGVGIVSNAVLVSERKPPASVNAGELNHLLELCDTVNVVENKSDDFNDGQCVLNKPQCLYLIVEERGRYVKAGVTGMTQLQLITRYQSNLPTVDYFLYVPITNGKW